MNIFDKRPLASILCIFLFGFVAFSQGEVWLRIAVAIIAPLLLLFSVLKLRVRRLLVGLCVSLMLSSLASYVYFDCIFFPTDSETVNREITADVLDVDEERGQTKLYIRTYSEDGELFSSHTMLMSVDPDDAKNVKVGDKIRFRGTVKSIAEFDGETRKYYAANNISAICELSDTIEVTSRGDVPLSNKIASYRERLTRRAMILSDNYSGRLISALLLGERDLLDSKTQLDFRRIGITHMLALSGMHLAILSIGITKLLAFFGIGKKTSGIVNILFTLLYMGLTGFPVSVVRAGIMLIIATTLFIFVGSRDALTSLSIAVFLIVVFSPNSIYDISLWLSAFATLGLIVFSEYEQGKRDRRARFVRDDRPKYVKIIFGILNWFKASILSSVFAICATMIITILDFNETSILSIISTLILTPFITVFMYIGALTLIIGNLIPIGALLRPISSLISWITSALSSIRNVFISTDHAITVVLSILLTLLLVIFFIVRLSKRAKRISVLLIAALLFTTYLSGYIFTASQRRNDDILYANNVDMSTIVFKSGGKTALLSSTTYNEFTIGKSIKVMENSGLTEFDSYIVTHYGYGLISHFKTVSAKFKIRSFVLPEPRNKQEEAILNWLIQEADSSGSKIDFFESKTPYYIGDIGITLNHSTPYGEDTVRTAFTVECDGVRYTYLSSGMLLEDYANFTYRITLDSDVIIFGNHGKSYKNTVHIDDSFINTQAFVLCSDNLYFTQDSYEIYKARGCKIYTHPEFISIKQ